MPKAARTHRAGSPIADAIKRTMSERGLTAYGLGKASNVSVSIITRWLNNERSPSLPTVEKIVLALDLVLVEARKVELINEESRRGLKRSNIERPNFEKPSIKEAVLDVLRHGKRRRTDVIVEMVSETIPGTNSKQVTAAVKAIKQHPPKGMILDALRNPQGNQYMLFYRPDAGDVAAVALDAVPLVKKCIETLVERRYGISPNAVERALNHMGKALPILNASAPTAARMVEECIEILHQPPAGRATTLALSHMLKVLGMLDSLLTAKPASSRR
jgi:transcriptional regulator with XRE-family HTH domain